MSTYVFIVWPLMYYTLMWGVFMSDIQLNSVLVGKAISKARQNKGVTQEVLSGFADIGRTHLSAIERGERKPTLETLWRIAFALDMRPNELVRKIEYEIEKSC